MRGPFKAHLGAMAAVGLIAIVCHLPVVRLPFVWDDFDTHVQNPHMQRTTNLLRYFDRAYWRESHAVLVSPYRPVREILLGAMRRVFGPSATAFHALSLAGHAANAMLVYVVAALILRNRLGALVAALVFALHPSHVEALAFAKNIGEIAATFFGLLALMAMLRLAHRFEYHGGTLWWVWAAAAAGCFALGLLTKESVAAVPLVATAWAALCTGGGVRKRTLAATAPLWVLLGVYLVLQFQSQELTVRTALADWAAPTGVWLRAVLVSKTIMKYVGMLVFPVAHVPWREFRLTGGEPVLWQAGACAGMAGLAAAWVVAVRRWPTGAVAVFWTVAALGPASNLVVNVGRPLAEQRLYFPSAGFALCAGAVFASLAAYRRVWRVAVWLVVALCVSYAALQIRGLAAWRTERALWRATLRHAPGCMAGHLNLGNFYVKIGHHAGAAAEFRRVRAARPDYAQACVNLGAVLGRMGRFDEALAVLREAAERFPQSVSVRNNLGSVSFRRSQWLREQGDAAGARTWLLEASRHFERVLEMNPGHAPAYVNLGNCWTALGRYAEARAMYEKSLAAFPEHCEAIYNLARLCVAEGKLREALTLYRRAAALNPRLSQAFVQVALVNEALGDWPAAAKAWDEVAARSKGWGSSQATQLAALMKLAAARERTGRAAAAREAWLRAAELAPRHPEVLEGLRRTAER